MRYPGAVVVTASLLVTGTAVPSVGIDATPPTRTEIEQTMGLRSEGDLVRGQLDTVGFVVTAEQADDVLATARRLEAEALAAEQRRFGPGGDRLLVGGVCPHDDHLYSARVTVHLTEHLDVPRVLLIGVFHAARLWDLENTLVFDSFQAWHGPHGPVPVDPLRDELLGLLPNTDRVVDNAMHCREHSLESIVPFLQAARPDVRIVPVLVPYAGWPRLSELAGHLSSALDQVMDAHGWELGRDLAVVVSNDAVHYGPDFDLAPFGTDASAYLEATARDHELIRDHLEGPLAAASLEGFLYRLVNPDDVRAYRIPWCGRFAVPFGLEVMRTLAARRGLPVPEGMLLRYGTTLSEPLLPVTETTRAAGLGTTAESNLHHWVGFTSIAYTVPAQR